MRVHCLVVADYLVTDSKNHGPRYVSQNNYHGPVPGDRKSNLQVPFLNMLIPASRSGSLRYVRYELGFAECNDASLGGMI